MEYKNMTEERKAEIRAALHEHTWSLAYGFLAVIMALTGIALAIMGKWQFALASCVLGNITLVIGQVKHTKSHRVLDEQ